MRSRPPHGMSVLEVAIAGGMFASALVASTQLLGSLSKASGGAKAALARAWIQSRVDRAANRGANLDKSAQFSWALHDCLSRNGTVLGGHTSTTCTATADYTPFYLVDAEGNWLGGIPTNPARFNLAQQPCASAGPACPFEVLTSFRATCPGNAATCEQALSISVRTEVRPASVGGVKVFGQVGGALGGKSTEMRGSIMARDINNLGQKTCGPGTLYRGTDEFGNPACIPDTPATPPCGGSSNNFFLNAVDFNNMALSCATFTLNGVCDSSAGNNQHLVGFQPDGTPICSPTDVPDTLITISVEQTVPYIGCPGGMIVTGLEQNGTSRCQPAEFFATQYNYLQAGLQTRILNQAFPAPFETSQATCYNNHTNWFGHDLEYGLCNCVPTPGINGGGFGTDGALKQPYFHSMSYLINPTINPATDGCGFSYFATGYDGQ